MKKCGKNRVAAAVLILALMLQMVGISGPVCALPEAAVDSATQGTPVSTPEELNAVRRDLGGSFYLTCDIIFTREDFAPGGAFYNEGEGFEPIGNKNAPFTGVFDGNGYEIKGLQINNRSAVVLSDTYGNTWKEQDVGLFGVNAGTVKNLRLTDSYVSYDDTLEELITVSCGGIAGTNTGMIYNCQSSAGINVQLSEASDSKYDFQSVLLTSGGICGSNQGEISYCKNTGSVRGNKAGGIVGETSEEATIVRCANEGDILSVSAAYAGGGGDGLPLTVISESRAGGIAGSGGELLFDCYNAGSVKAYANVQRVSGGADRYTYTLSAGGLVGRAGDLGLNHCYNVGAVAAQASREHEDVTVYAAGMAVGSSISPYQCLALNNTDYAVLIPNEPPPALQYQYSEWQMKALYSYNGFDFENVWIMDAESGYPYPQLRAPVPDRWTAVSTKEQLDDIRHQLSGRYYLTNDIVFTEEDFAEGGLFYNQGEGWTPIGNFDYPFTGQFDGRGYEIRGLESNRTSALPGTDATGSDWPYGLGLFGVNQGTIQNLGVADARLSFLGDQNISVYCGGIAGRNEGTIENCRSGATLNDGYPDNTVVTYDMQTRVISGGICGSNTGLVTQCENNGAVNGMHAGGIAGESLLSSEISYCMNLGPVRSLALTKSVSGSQIYTVMLLGSSGGIVGRAEWSYILNCANGGSVEAYAKADNITSTNGNFSYNYYYDIYSGGIVGVGNGRIVQCCNTGVLNAHASQTNTDNIRLYQAGIGSADTGELEVVNCYYLDDGAAQGGGIPCSVEELQSSAHLDKLNFEDVWEIDAAEGYSYPQIRQTLEEEKIRHEGFLPISTKEELDGIRNHSNLTRYYLTQDILFTSEDFEQGGLVGPGGWHPLQFNQSDSFYGVLDGCGHSIIGLNTFESGGLFDIIGRRGQILNLHFRATEPITSQSTQFAAFASGNEGVISDCSASFDIEAGALLQEISGIVGRNEHEIINCWVSGSINTSSSTPSKCGGIACTNSGVIRGCRNEMNITGRGQISGIAENTGVIENCCNLGVITGTAASGQTDYSMIFAGISSWNGGRISQCYNNALFQISGDIPSQSLQYCAGIVAENDGSVRNCFNAGSITENVPSKCVLGGIVAKNAGWIQTCYNVGPMTSTVGQPWVGGVSSGLTSFGFYRNNFYAASCINPEDNVDNNAAALTDEQLTDPASYKGFDFASIWTILPGSDYPYPQLQGMELQESICALLIKQPPKKDRYLTGEIEFSSDGLELELLYASGRTAPLADGYTVNGFDTAKSGDIPVTFSYQGFTSEPFTIHVTSLYDDCTVVLEDASWQNVVIPHDVYIGPGATLQIGSGVEIYGDIYVLGTLAAYQEFTLSGTIFCKELSYTDAPSPVAHGSVLLSEQNDHLSFFLSDTPVTYIPLEFCWNNPVKFEGKVSGFGNALKIADLYVEDQLISIGDNGAFSFEGIEIGDKMSVTAKYVTVFGNEIIHEVPICLKPIRSLELASPPAKTEFYEDEELDLSGMVLVAHYEDGTSEAVPFTASLSSREPGVQSLEISALYGASIIITYDVTILANPLVRIAVTTPPDRTTYKRLEEFDPTGMVVTAYYKNGKELSPVPFEVSGYDPALLGKQTVTVAYAGLTDTVEVTVVPHPVESIDILSPPAKTTYYLNEQLNTDGLRVSATRADGQVEEITGYELSGYDPQKLGPQTITVSYEGKTAGFTVTVLENTVTALTLTRKPNKLSYLQGESLEPTGMVVTAIYLDGTQKEVTGYELSGYDPQKLGTQTVTVSYEGKTAGFTVTVLENVVTALTLTRKPNKLSYLQNEAFDPTGMVVTATYLDGTQKTVTGYDLSGYDPQKLGTQTITVSYGGKTASFTVTVKASVPHQITSATLSIQNGFISKIGAGSTVNSLLSSIAERNYVKVYQGSREVTGDTKLGTGMVVKLMDGNTVLQTLTIVVTGDTNGDGKVTITDMLAVKSHLLGKVKLNGAAAKAADTSGDKSISITDFIQIKAFLLGKGSIKPQA